MSPIAATAVDENGRSGSTGLFGRSVR